MEANNKCRAAELLTKSCTATTAGCQLIAVTSSSALMTHFHIFLNGFFGTGLFFVLPCTDSFIKVDMRTISFDIPPQEVSLHLPLHLLKYLQNFVRFGFPSPLSVLGNMQFKYRLQVQCIVKNTYIL